MLIQFTNQTHTSDLKLSLLKVLGVLILSIVLMMSYTAIFASSDATVGTDLMSTNRISGNCPATINFGETIECSIDAPGDTDSYTFSANENDTVFLRMSSADQLQPGIRIHGPDGTELCRASGSATAEIASCTLTATGTHTILSYDSFNGTFVGSYGLTLQRINNPGNATSLDWAQTITDTIRVAGQVDSFSFSADADDTVFLIMGSADQLQPGIRIHGPDGVEPVNCRAKGSASARVTTCRLTASGIHTILAYDSFNGTFVGDYGLTLQRINNPGNATPLNWDETVADQIDSAGHANSYSFSAKAGKKVFLRMSSSEQLQPGISIYGPDGVQIEGCTASGSATAEIASCALTTTGVHTILAYDSFNGTFTGSYNISLRCLTFPCGGGPEPTPTATPTPPPPSLVLIYAVLDNDLGDDADNIERLINNAEAGVHGDMRVRMLIDTPGNDGSIIYDLMHDTNPSCPKLGNLTCNGRYIEGENFWRNGDEDTAHPETLYDFVVDAVRTYSDTEKILLSLVGHGSGWSANALPGQPSKWGSQPNDLPNHEERVGGLLWDDTPGEGSGGRSMSTKALGVALNWIKTNTNRSIDLLYLDACSMGMASVAYEIRDSVDYLLASPNTAWASFAYAEMLRQTTPDKDAKALGQAWLAAEANVLRHEQYPFTLSLYDLSQMNAIATATTALADALIEVIPGSKGQVTQAAAQTERFESNYDGLITTSDHYADQDSFALQLEGEFGTVGTLNTAIQGVKAALALLVVSQELHSGKPWLYPPNEWHWQEAGGLSVYLPLQKDDPKRALYTATNLQWAQDTHWDELLNAYWGENNALAASTDGDVLPTCNSTRSCEQLSEQLPLQPTIFLPLIQR